ncbi:MAG TPA: hypothetical protein VK529_10805 [Gemmatimonadaceae bacterium]|nr:hypothetical protein [Gemmatimonadaceae bacterium]
MTARQTAVAAGADLKWMVNSAALLGRRVRYDRQQAKWWGLVWLLTEQLGLSLRAAAAVATVALRGGSSSTQVIAGGDPSGSASLIVDLARYESIFLANLSRALVHETPRRRGRPPRLGLKSDGLTTARHYGVDLGLIRSAIRRTPAERLALLEKNAAFVRDMRRRTA